MFTRQHYNIIAKDIREEFPMWNPMDATEKNDVMSQRTVLVNLALRLAYRFQEDNPNFDPCKFLDACSPDTDVYPLSELWEA